ncbi:MAG: mucoidy inhibitor MuiA family protein [Hyphomicrobiales bacterium]
MSKKSLLLGSGISILLAIPGWAEEVTINPTIDAVTVYPSGAMITETADVSLSAGMTTLVIENFPLHVDVDTLRAKGTFDGTVVVQSINHRQGTEELTTPEIKALQEEMELLVGRRGVFEDELLSAQAQLKLVEEFARQAPRGFSEAIAKGGDALSEWQTALDAIQTGQKNARNDIRRLKKSIQSLDGKHAELEEQVFELRKVLSSRTVLVDVNASDAATGTFKLSYQTPHANWNAGYDAFLQSDIAGDAQLDLVQLARVSQQTERPWENVALTLSTTQPARGTSAPALNALQVFEQVEQDRYRDLQKLDEQGLLAERTLSTPSSAFPSPDVAGNVLVQSRVVSRAVGQQAANADIGRYKANFEIPGRVSISGDGAVRRLTLARHSVSPELLAVSVPSVLQSAFLHAQIKNETGAPLLAGDLSAYRDGTFMGRTHFEAMAISEERSLGFGPDHKIGITYVTEDRRVAEQGIISSERTDTRRYVTKVTNNHDRPIRVRVVDRQPFSESETIQVERLSSSTAPSEENVKDQRGILAWSFEYEPGESKDIRFDYRLTWPAEKNVTFGSSDF